MTSISPPETQPEAEHNFEAVPTTTENLEKKDVKADTPEQSEKKDEALPAVTNEGGVEAAEISIHRNDEAGKEAVKEERASGQAGHDVEIPKSVEATGDVGEELSEKTEDLSMNETQQPAEHTN